MLKPYLLFTLACCALPACQENNPSKANEAIMHIMEQQQTCWNDGNLDCFMDGYWKSDSLMFIGKNGITYGFANTLDRYKKTYPDREAMGKLSFDIVELQHLSPESSYMIGKWTLNRERDDLQGHFTLLFRKMNGKWFIVRDHSS